MGVIGPPELVTVLVVSTTVSSEVSALANAGQVRAHRTPAKTASASRLACVVNKMTPFIWFEAVQPQPISPMGPGESHGTHRIGRA
jgi:hypothetical protein